MRIDTLATEVRATDGGELPAYAWPGGYPLAYFTESGEELCPTCATAELLDADADGWHDDPPAYVEPHYEGPPITCAGCGAIIESAYGDPAEEG